MATDTFDIIAEDPQVKHIARKVQQSAVQEHRCDNRKQMLAVNNVVRHGAVKVQKLQMTIAGQGKLIDKDDDIDGNNGYCEKRKQLPGIFIAQGNHNQSMKKVFN